MAHFNYCADTLETLFQFLTLNCLWSAGRIQSLNLQCQWVIRNIYLSLYFSYGGFTIRVWHSLLFLPLIEGLTWRFVHPNRSLYNMSGPIKLCFARVPAIRKQKEFERNNTAVEDAPENVCYPHIGQTYGIYNQPLLPQNEIRKRAHVNPLSEQYRAITWILLHVAPKGYKPIISKCAHRFPPLFREYQGQFTKDKSMAEANESKNGVKNTGRRWGEFTMSSGRQRRNQVSFKTICSRGANRAAWVISLYKMLNKEFDRLREADVKFNMSLLRALEITIISNEPNTSTHHYSVIHSGKSIGNAIKIRWIQRFMLKNRTVRSFNTGKVMVSFEKQGQIEKQVVYHLGWQKLAFESESQNNDVENVDETHVVIKCDKAVTLGLVGDKKVKYADVVSGDEDTIMLVCITGGCKAVIRPPFLRFKPNLWSFPIRSLPETTPGVSYRSSPKGWMDSEVWLQWLTTRSATTSIQDKKSEDCLLTTVQVTLKTTKATIIFKQSVCFPEALIERHWLRSTCRLCFIQKIKECWKNHWDADKCNLVQNGKWKDGATSKDRGGKLLNPGKEFFLKLGAEGVREVNITTNNNGLSYTRKSMIMTGLLLNTDSV